MPAPTVKPSLYTTALRWMPSELLQEEGRAGRSARIAEFAKPGELCRPRAGLALAAGNQPVDALQIQAGQRSQQRLGRHEAHGRGHAPEVVHPPQEVSRLHGDAHPHVPRPRQPRRHARESLGALREDLKGVLRARRHHVEHLRDECFRDVGVEQIGHRVHEHDARTAPALRQVEQLGPQRQVEPIREGLREPLRDALGVAAFAARRHLGATHRGIPSGFGPFDARVVGHGRENSMPPAADAPPRRGSR